ncbi:HRDC domain-containing protein [Pontibacter sp. SGAir0037]|uniref:ribonuclease D n=1 Tax=Pontibacter sp. SGAir0037 TaxID=2571030 RepID=UPI0010CCE229|nr:HRDC domain-containing protein [Pontibacter sp. SGAir0037]QCR23851.1 ribonuclease D [Pontibacter sp. SGAir0037]
MKNLALTYDGISIELVATDEQLSQIINKLLKADVLALDLEFDQNRFSYGFNLCLIQLYDGAGTCYIIDPFNIKDLKPLFSVFENPAIEKIIHHSNNDILLLDKMGCSIRNVMDTDVAAKLLNYERSSLATVLKQEFDKEIDKSQQSSNWNKRPLTEEQLQYAAIDVIYLHDVRKALLQQLKELDRLAWLQEENLLLEQLRYSEPSNPHLKLRNASKLNLYQQYLLKDLYTFRDEMAKQLNKPASFVIANDALVELANSPNTDLHEWLNHTKGIHGSLKKPKHETSLKNALATAKHKAKEENISHDYPSNKYYRPFKTAETEKRKEELTLVQKEIAQTYGEFVTRLIINQNLITDYSFTGHLNCNKKYATDIVLATARKIGVALPEVQEKE